MGRAVVEVLLPFLLPFAGYALWLTFGRRYPFVASAWRRGPVAALVVGGLTLAVLSLIGAGLFGPRSRGGYVPAHIDGGRLVPGRME